jgi:NAD(P)H-hydrate epimerase
MTSPEPAIRPLSRAEVRAVDSWAAEQIGLPTLVLMENAGRGAAELLLDRIDRSRRVVVLCGSGNNGGDGGVVARHLDLAGVPVHVVWFGRIDKMAIDAMVQFHVLRNLGIHQRRWEDAFDPAVLADLLADADWIVDGLLGTGLSRPVVGPLREVIEMVNRLGKPVLALDLPSGLDADTGRPLGVAVRATLTATFVAPKMGFIQAEALPYLGGVHVIPIGIPIRQPRTGDV